MILNIGAIPFVDFKVDEKYKVVDKYIHSQIPQNYMDYKPSQKSVIEFIERCNEKNILCSWDNLDYLKYKEVVRLLSLNPTSEELHKHYLKLVSKLLAFGNKENVIKYELSKKINTKYSENIILEASEKKYVFKEKIVVFNDDFPCSDYFKTIINAKHLKIENDKILKNVYQQNMTRPQIAEKSNLSISTVRRFLKENNISTTDNKKIKTIQLIQEFKNSNPSATQQECVKKINLSIATVKRYWND